MAFEVSKNELKSFRPEKHNDIHHPNEGDEITTIFSRKYTKSMWYSSVLSKLSVNTDDAETIYTANKLFHYLLYTYLTQKTPTIKVKPDYVKNVRIKMAHNFASNKFEYIRVLDDNIQHQNVDNVWYDSFYQFFQSSGAGKRDNHNLGIGNITYFSEWSSYIPSYNTNIDLPFYYSFELSNAVPLYYKNSMQRFEHRCKFRNIKDLIRMQINETVDNAEKPRWVDVPLQLPKNKNVIDSYLEISEEQKPEMWGRYALITEGEKQYHMKDDNNEDWDYEYQYVKTSINGEKIIYKNKPENSGDYIKELVRKTKTTFIRDVVSHDSSNPHSYGDTAEISIEDENLTLAYFWVAKNMDSVKYNNHSNYTTNTFDLHSGFDPIKENSINYNDKEGPINNLSSDHLNIAFSRKQTWSSPDTTGYHGYAYGNDCMGYEPDITVIPKDLKVKLLCTINNNDIMLHEDTLNPENNDPLNLKKLERGNNFIENSINKNENDNNPKFIICERSLILRKWQIVYEKDDNGVFQYKYTLQ